MKKDLKELWMAVLQKALNTYLSLDPEMPERMQALKGKIVTIELLKVSLQFHLVFTGTKIILKSDLLHENEPLHADTIIKGTPLRLLHMTLSRETRKQFFADDVSIEGNLELGQQVMDLFDHLEIDWEEILSKWIGDAPAHHLGRLSKKLSSWLQQTKDTLLQNVNEYVHEEVDFFPARFALQDFFDDVDELRMDTDRLEARIEHLKKTMAMQRGAK